MTNDPPSFEFVERDLMMDLFIRVDCRVLLFRPRRTFIICHETHSPRLLRTVGSISLSVSGITRCSAVRIISRQKRVVMSRIAKGRKLTGEGGRK